MKLVKRIKFLPIITLLLVNSCENKTEIEPEILAKVYVDLLVVEDYYKNSDSVSIKRTEVFNKYSVTEDIYDSTFKNFSYDREKWEYFFELANTYLDSLKSYEKKGKLKSVP